MAYTLIEPEFGIQPIGSISTTQNWPLGTVAKAYDNNSNAAALGAGGGGEFIYLAIPASTAITAELLYGFTPSDYKVAALATSTGTTTTSGQPVALAVTTVASNTSVQYGWFQVGGRSTVLKTAVTVNPNVPVYLGGTAGRIKVIGSAFKGFIGMRTANATTVTSTTSTVAIYMNGRPCLTVAI